jgi:osmoprotectant transport system substrate-binding protein
MTPTRKRLLTAAALIGAVATALVGCSSGNPLSSPSTPAASGGSSSTVVIGSQAYASNEIIAEVYAQALEAKGIKVTRKFNIGQRDAYMPAVKSGEVQLVPEYTGNLLQYFNPKATETDPQGVYTALKSALPSNLAVLDMATATDQDSYTVTKAFADKWHLTSIADLAKVTVPLTLGGNAELADRPYGPKGLKSTYGVTVGFKATGDTTEQALVAGTVNVADIYTSSPKIKTDNLVVLQDPKALILASNVVPLVNSSVSDKVTPVINAVQAKLTPEVLVQWNVENTVDQQSAAQIATKWLKEQGLS